MFTLEVYIDSSSSLISTEGVSILLKNITKLQQKTLNCFSRFSTSL